MLPVLSEHYFIDLDEVEKYLDITETNESSTSGSTEVRINVIKFELVKMLFEVILSEQEVPDEKLGAKASANTSIPFKLAFNTLLNKKLINKY